MSKLKPVRVPIKLANGKRTTGIRNKKVTPPGTGNMPPSKVALAPDASARLALLQQSADAYSTRQHEAAALLRSNAYSLHGLSVNPHRAKILAQDVHEVTELLDNSDAEADELIASYKAETATLDDDAAAELMAEGNVLESQRLGAATKRAADLIAFAASRNPGSDAEARADAFAAAAAVEQIRSLDQERRTNYPMDRGDDSAGVQPGDDLLNPEYGSAIVAQKLADFAEDEARRADIQAKRDRGDSPAWAAASKAQNHAEIAKRRANGINLRGDRR